LPIYSRRVRRECESEKEWRFGVEVEGGRIRSKRIEWSDLFSFLLFYF
jgi:hypothetical protein